MDATPSVSLPADAAGWGVPERPPAPLSIRGSTFVWGSRTYVMGIVNVTPDSFSGDGLLGHADPVEAAVAQAQRMAAEGADILDVGGESSRPGHADVTTSQELDRVVPVIRAIRDALPHMPLSVDTIKPEVAEAAIDAGADVLNDVWGVRPSDDLARVAAARRVPYVLMHNRTEARYRSVVAEVLADLQAAVERAVRAGCEWERLVIDPGIGFGKTAEQNLAVLSELSAFRVIGRPILVGASRKSTIGKVLDLPADQRLEGTLAITALGASTGADIVRVHDVAANLRAARMADAIVRGRRP
ncbi:MAG: dihydropteroate synthase [Chloroflexota bacterium]|jgi:dihydropteroate synthase|nr:dihydropteroate synthase [Chloroflexota bacterium]